MKYRYILAMAATVVALVSCTSKEPISTDSSSAIVEQELTITASLDEAEPQTRTERAADKSVLWSPGDQISLFYGSGTDGGSCFTAQNTELAKTANFTGTISVITAGNEVSSEGTYFWATYPYCETASCDGSSITTVLPSMQIAKANSFADDLFPTMGRSRGLRMGFYNICGGICFSVSQDDIASVTLEGNNDEVLAGTITVGYGDDGLPIVTNIANGSKTITVSAPEGESLQVGQKYYLVFVPTSFEHGFTLTFTKRDYNQAVYERAASTTIRRAVFGTLTTPDSGLEWSMVPSITFPDPNFNAYMMQNFDTNANGVLEREEALAVTSINVTTDNIKSVEGIAYCTNLHTLNCNGSDYITGLLTNLDVRFNTALTNLSCGNNKLTTFDVKSNTALTDLRCSNNQLTSLDVSSNTALTLLECGFNQLTSLDVSHNLALTSLSCNRNQLTSLDVSLNTSLTNLICPNNQLTSLEVSTNTSLTTLSCFNNQLTSLDISSNTALTQLSCDSNQLTSLDVSKNIALFFLSCGSNQLTNLDVSSNTALITLWCRDNQRTVLDISHNTVLDYLTCYYNKLTSLDVSKNTALTILYCYNNKLTSLDVSQNTALKTLYCYSNQLTSLDVSLNTALTELNCYNNLLTTLNVSKNTALTNLDCSPMNDSNGNNLLSFLYIADGQTIPNVTGEGRSANYVPDDTIITIAPGAGGNEGTGDDEL